MRHRHWRVRLRCDLVPRGLLQRRRLHRLFIAVVQPVRHRWCRLRPVCVGANVREWGLFVRSHGLRGLLQRRSLRGPLR
jgi:hypothetical protein